MIILDTSVLSLALRRKAGSPTAEHLRHLILDDALLGVPGIVVQEVLSCMRTDAHEQRVDGQLRSFRLLLADRSIHVAAAQIASACRRRGVAAEAPDCLIAAHTIRVDGELFTLDDDFKHIAKLTDLRLYAA